DRALFQQVEQAGGQIEVCQVDETKIGLEGISAIGDAVEDRPGGDPGQEAFQVGVHQQVDHHLVPLRQVLQPPGIEVGGSAVHVVPVCQECPHQVGADEAAAPEYQYRPLQVSDFLCHGRHIVVCSDNYLCT